MGKGWRLTTSRSERFLGSYGYGNGHGSSGVATGPELIEEDVWSAVGDDVADNLVEQNSFEVWRTRSNGESVKSLRVGPVWGWKGNSRHVSGLSLAFEDRSSTTLSSKIVHQNRGNDDVGVPDMPSRSCQMATSAPVNVPDWSKILGVDSVESPHDYSDFDGPGVDCDGEVVPPHEYLARSRRADGASVFEAWGGGSRAGK